MATDPNDDNLTFFWQADAGIITGEGTEVYWIAPDRIGMYTITCMVIDNIGGEAKENINITVVPKPTQSPVIKAMLVTMGKIPSFASTGELIGITHRSTVGIECVAEDPDGYALSFSWTATDGKIMGDGSKIAYWAQIQGKQTITVVVTNNHGGKTISAVRFNIPCCGSHPTK
jgi:hypothetical protein